jgi:hypothetical protein
MKDSWVMENPATYLVADASFAVKCAREAHDRNDEEAEARFSRIAILLYAVSLEGFINFVFEYHDPETGWENLSLKDKWLQAAKTCMPCNGRLQDESGAVVYRPGDPIETFRENEEPFLSFLELKAFRNRVVHLKPPFANVESEKVEEHLSREEYFHFSRLPKFLQHARNEHAETAKRIYEAMAGELDRQMKGTILNLFHAEGVVCVQTLCPDPGPDFWAPEDA